jgi:hypothetical protein
MKPRLLPSFALVAGMTLLVTSGPSANSQTSQSTVAHIALVADPACIQRCIDEANAFYDTCVGGDPSKVTPCQAEKDVYLRECLRVQCGIILGGYELLPGGERAYRIDAQAGASLALHVRDAEALVSVNGVPSYALGPGLHVLPDVLAPGLHELLVTPLATQAGVTPSVDVFVR